MEVLNGAAASVNARCFPDERRTRWRSGRKKLKPVFGYLHRNHEKIGENTSYLGSMPYTDRPITFAR